MKKWYVHDAADCFGSFETHEAAAHYAAGLVDGGFEGVHIVYMSDTQVALYAKTGNLRKAFHAK